MIAGGQSIYTAAPTVAGATPQTWTERGVSSASCRILHRLTAWLTVTLKPWGGRLAIRKGKHPVAEPSERRTIAGPYPPLISTLTAPDAPRSEGPWIEALRAIL